jgi:hypothetical protein
LVMDSECPEDMSCFYTETCTNICEPAMLRHCSRLMTVPSFVGPIIGMFVSVLMCNFSSTWLLHCTNSLYHFYLSTGNTYLLLCLHNCDETDSFMCRIGLDKIAHLESAAQDSVYWLDKRVNTIPCPSMLRW